MLLGVLACALFGPLCFAEETQPTPIPKEDAGPKEPTKEEIEALIEKAGTTPPEWWDSVKLDFPIMLDLTWKQPASPKDQANNLAVYVWNVINTNPSKWKEGAKLLQHTLKINKDDPDKLKRSEDALAKIYHDLLQDYARAAYWWRKAGSVGCGNCPVGLADCYRKLGSRKMAIEVLEKYGQANNQLVVRTWADVGEFDKALEMALTIAKNPQANGPAANWFKMQGFFLAGDVCRMAGRFDEAVVHYMRAQDAGNQRAKAAIDTIKCFELLDLAKIPDGEYKSGSQGYSSIVQVAVLVKDHKIEDVKIVDHHEKQYYGSIIETPRRIIEKQGVKGVDVFSSATLTSEAIIKASAKALAEAAK